MKRYLIIFGLFFLALVFFFIFHIPFKSKKTIYDYTIISNNITKKGKFSITYSFSDCMYITNISDFEKYFNAEPIIRKDNERIIISTYFYSYKGISKVVLNYTIRSFQFYGDSLELNIYEYPEKNISRYDKCLRKWSLELVYLPENITYIWINHYRYWNGKFYWGGKTVKIYVGK